MGNRRKGTAGKCPVTVQIFPEKNPQVELGSSSIIGTRSRQEDTVFAYACEERAIGILCDGMGGLASGEIASQTAVQSLADAWFARDKIADVPGFLKQEAIRADELVYEQKNEQGERLGSGTTLVAALVQNGELFWLSIGDSRIYLIRGEEILSVCREHNYRLTLDLQLERGEITREEYAAQEHKAAALISYLGMGGIPLMEINRSPFPLGDGDIVLLSSDGLYKSLSEEEILRIIHKNRENMQSAALALTDAALGNKQSGQDNTSVVILRQNRV